jgi:hypothetical protein
LVYSLLQFVSEQIFLEIPHTMTLSKKFSALAAVLVIGFLSIYATQTNFLTGNQTQNQITVTLNMQSGAQIPIVVPPGQTLPMQFQGDTVIGVYVYGAYDPAGMNAIIPNPSGGAVKEMWVMGPNGTVVGATTEPDTGTMS